MRIKTPGFREVTGPRYRERIIAESQRRYCKPVAEVRALIRRRAGRGGVILPPAQSPGDASAEDLAYDEF
ncbi:MAG: hypothetical protein KJ749_03290 [Planctomycetes bacterium]|nr:hypothetical protein [Planctomycetota bacterium]